MVDGDCARLPAAAPEKSLAGPWQRHSGKSVSSATTVPLLLVKEGKKDSARRLQQNYPTAWPRIEARLMSLVYTGGVHGNHFSPNRFRRQRVQPRPKLMGGFGLYSCVKGTHRAVVLRRPTW